MVLPTLGRVGMLADPTGDPLAEEKLREIVPIDYIIDWFKKRQPLAGIKNRVLILKSETASGKSTYFLSELYRRMIKTAGSGGSIICTQPRILTAVRNVFEIIKYNRDIFALGGAIGYSAGGMKVLPTASASLLSVTVGVLGMELKLNDDEYIIGKYKYIIIDETHERDMQIDMTLYMLKNFLLRNQNNPKCPFVICMSATFEPQQFVSYFQGSMQDNHIWVRGASYPRQLMWDWNSGRIINDYGRATAECVRKIITEAPDEDPRKADILIFMPGVQEFTEVSKWLTKLNLDLADSKLPVFSLIRIDSDAMKTKNKEYSRLDIPVELHPVSIKGEKFIPTRRVIISTNVAETGLTLENLKYVIDGGFNKETEFNPNYCLSSLLVKPAPQSRITQRIGRVGRNFPGVFYPLYPEYIYNRLPKQQLPQILLDDISGVTIDIFREQARKIGVNITDHVFNWSIDMIDPPSGDMLSTAIGKLYEIGFVGMSSDASINTEYRITELGALSSVFTMLSPEAIRMMLSSFFWECSMLDVISIAAYLMTPSHELTISDIKTRARLPILWDNVYKHTVRAHKWNLLTADEFLDGILLIGAIKRVIIKGIPHVRKFCNKTNINYNGLLNFIRKRDDIIEQALNGKFDVFKHEKNSLLRSNEQNMMSIVVKLKHCIYDGYRCNLLTLRGSNYVSQRGGLEVVMPALLKPISDAYKTTALPEYIVHAGLNTRMNRKDELRSYLVAVDKISAMSGFVPPDVNFS